MLYLAVLVLPRVTTLVYNCEAPDVLVTFATHVYKHTQARKLSLNLTSISFNSLMYRRIFSLRVFTDSLVPYRTPSQLVPLWFMRLESSLRLIQSMCQIDVHHNTGSQRQILA